MNSNELSSEIKEKREDPPAPTGFVGFTTYESNPSTFSPAVKTGRMLDTAVIVGLIVVTALIFVAWHQRHQHQQQHHRHHRMEEQRQQEFQSCGEGGCSQSRYMRALDRSLISGPKTLQTLSHYSPHQLPHSDGLHYDSRRRDKPGVHNGTANYVDDDSLSMRAATAQMVPRESGPYAEFQSYRRPAMGRTFVMETQ